VEPLDLAGGGWGADAGEQVGDTALVEYPLLEWSQYADLVSDPAAALGSSPDPRVSSRSSQHPDEHPPRRWLLRLLPSHSANRTLARVAPHTLMTTFPRACPSSRYRIASGASPSG
jgi:hypothetical protein